MKIPQIKKHIDKNDKKNTYKELRKRRDEAILTGHYLEVIIYAYAMIEDRTLSFLHHLYIVNRNIYPYIIEPNIYNSVFFLMNPNKDIFKEEYKPDLEKISVKMKVIQKICEYCEDDEFICEIKKFLEENLNINELIQDIKSLEKWCDKRNEIIHCLYNKNLEDADKQIKDIALEGERLSSSFGSYTDIIKARRTDKKSIRSIYENRITN